MLTDRGNDNYDGTHITFRVTGTKDGRKTKLWMVYNSADPENALGSVAWWAPWRCYCFKPQEYVSTIFERVCLREIADFIEVRTGEHKMAHAADKAARAKA